MIFPNLISRIFFAKFFKLLIILSLAISANGCLYPAKQTYYEIAPTDGRLYPSKCTYPSDRKDSIHRPLLAAELYLTTKNSNSGDLEVSIQVSHQNNSVQINGRQIKIETEGQPPIYPGEIEKEIYDSGNKNDKRPVKSWIYLVYPIKTTGLNNFSLSFGPSTFAIDGEYVQTNPIGFSKVTKSGIYMTTVNC